MYNYAALLRFFSLALGENHSDSIHFSLFTIRHHDSSSIAKVSHLTN